MATKYPHTLIVLAICCVFLSTLSLISASKRSGFSVDFIHHDSPLSPFYNPTEEPSERVRKSIQRSINRVNVLKNSLLSASDDDNETIASTVVPYGGAYLMRFGLGNPSHEILAFADTGSDITWTQCLPCENCYRQEAPFFDPKESSTYKDFPCSSETCQALGQLGSCQSSCRYQARYGKGSHTTGNQLTCCRYRALYGDGSHSTGNLAGETITFNSTSGRPISFPNIAFGCGHDNAGLFRPGSSGIVGLGRGPLSFISQLSTAIDNKFSYCLTNQKSQDQSSKLNFGSQADISKEGFLSTPLGTKVSPSGEKLPYYYLILESLSVNNDEERISFKTNYSSSSNKNVSDQGNIIIDSGTTLTILPSETYKELESKVKNAIDAEPVSDSSGLSLCYSNLRQVTKLPIITAHFTGADIVLKPYNSFIQVSDDHLCLAFTHSEIFSIFGNVAQRDFLIEYDLNEEKVSFLPTDCTMN